jgi:RimJ/RimL family protein N-acetyltransferase
VSRVFPHNTPSLKLLERAGWRRVGVYQRHGQLDGIWLDVVVVEKLL